MDLKNNRPWVSALSLVFLLFVGCGGGGGGATLVAPTDFEASLTIDVKTLHFQWKPQATATQYKLRATNNPELPVAAFPEWSAALPKDTATYSAEISVHLMQNTRFVVEACNAAGCGYSNVLDPQESIARAVGYFKASNVAPMGNFGAAVALSADGKTLAVGAPGESSSATGINGNQEDQSAPQAGAVYIFDRMESGWTQSAYIKASNTDAFDLFGFSLSLSADGNVLAVGAPGEDGSETGPDANQSNNDSLEAGAVYVFRRNEGRWSQEAYLKASPATAGDLFGERIALSADGQTLGVAAEFARDAAGNVFVFKRGATEWAQFGAPLAPSISDPADLFGSDVALSADGDVLIVGALCESSASTFGALDPNDNTAICAGAAYVFERSVSGYVQRAYLKAPNTDAGDLFGHAVDISPDGNTIAIGAPLEASNGVPTDNSSAQSGAVYVYRRDGAVWAESDYLKSNTPSTEVFGWSVKFADNATKLFVGAPFESSSTQGPYRRSPPDQTLRFSGAVFQFVAPSHSNFVQVSTVLKAPNADPDDNFGEHLATDAAGTTVAIGAAFEAGSGTDPSDNIVPISGAVYLY